MKKVFLLVIISAVLTFIMGIILLPFLRKIKAGQPILKYVKAHKDKSGTPTMGGLFFIIPCCIIYLIFYGVSNRLALLSVCIGLAYMIVGFLDDFIKIKYKQNEGLKPYQKILFQSAIALVASFFAYKNGLTIFYIPFTTKTINFSFWGIPIIFIVFIAITNSVNLTDGLDGLAGNSTMYYLIFLSTIIYFQIKKVPYLYQNYNEFNSLIALSCCLCSCIASFLLFNVGKASVFMGDTGSLALGGFIGSVSIFSYNTLVIPILGFVFVLSSLSVIIQVGYFKKTGKRVFLMSPIHHHIQLKGYSEGKISYLYSLITCIIGVLLLIFYL